MSNRDTIRWGIVGCGDVTEVKSGPGFQQARGSQLVAVMRRNADLAADYARRHGVPRWYGDAQALINDPEVDAVYIATPPGSHLELAVQVARASKPCYVEKPMARSAAECDAMINAFTGAKRKLFVAYYRRAQPRFLKVKELLDSGAVGKVTGVNYRMAMPAPTNADPTKGSWRIDATNAGGGLLLDMGSHALDLLDYFFGPLRVIAGKAVNLTATSLVEDVATVTFLTADGVPGVAAWNFATAIKEDILEISGTAGRLVFSVFGTEPVRLVTEKDTLSFEFPALAHVAQPLIQTVVDELLGLGTCPSTAETARRTSAVMDTMLAGYYGGRDDAFWDRPDTWPGRRSLMRG